MPSMALDTSFSSLPFAPLPHLVEKIPRARLLKLFRVLDGYGGTAQGKNSKQKLDCRALLGEESMASKVSRVSLFQENDRMDEEGAFYWIKLASRLVPVAAKGESTGGLIRVLGTDSAREQQWSPFWHLCSSDDVVGDGLLGSFHGFSASAAAVQSIPPSRQNQEDPEKQDFHVNIGYAIRTLREELPSMFYKELTYDIYRTDIAFRDPMNMVGGIDNYKLIFRALRFHGRIFFKALWVDILRIWQPSDNVIMVRWQVRGIPRVPWEAQGIFDGTSEYKLDKQGKIYEHKVDNVALNARPKLKVPTVEELLRVATCPSTPKPTFFQKTQDVFTVLMPYLFQFTWVRYYLALTGTVGCIKTLTCCDGGNKLSRESLISS